MMADRQLSTGRGRFSWAYHVAGLEAPECDVYAALHKTR